MDSFSIYAIGSAYYKNVILTLEITIYLGKSQQRSNLSGRRTTLWDLFSDPLRQQISTHILFRSKS